MTDPNAWVQCENSKCLKWRKIPRASLESLNNISWYCYMNPDRMKASCEFKQETMKKKKGEQFVYSLMEEGSLVWAKISGFPSWPAILCSDIIEGNYASFDEDEDLKHYHVEYFGRPRSHSWVLARNVEIYVSGNAPPPYFLAKSRGMASAKAKESFEIAVHEADKLLLLKPIERLKKCIFKPISKANDNSNRNDESTPIAVRCKPKKPNSNKVHPQGRKRSLKSLFDEVSDENSKKKIGESKKGRRGRKKQAKIETVAQEKNTPQPVGNIQASSNSLGKNIVRSSQQNVTMKHQSVPILKADPIDATSFSGAMPISESSHIKTLKSDKSIKDQMSNIDNFLISDVSNILRNQDAVICNSKSAACKSIGNSICSRGPCVFASHDNPKRTDKLCESNSFSRSKVLDSPVTSIYSFKAPSITADQAQLILRGLQSKIDSSSTLQVSNMSETKNKPMPQVNHVSNSIGTLLYSESPKIPAERVQQIKGPERKIGSPSTISNILDDNDKPIPQQKHVAVAKNPLNISSSETPDMVTINTEKGLASTLSKINSLPVTESKFLINNENQINSSLQPISTPNLITILSSKSLHNPLRKEIARGSVLFHPPEQLPITQHIGCSNQHIADKPKLSSNSTFIPRVSSQEGTCDKETVQCKRSNSNHEIVIAKNGEERNIQTNKNTAFQNSVYSSSILYPKTGNASMPNDLRVEPGETRQFDYKSNIRHPAVLDCDDQDSTGNSTQIFSNNSMQERISFLIKFKEFADMKKFQNNERFISWRNKAVDSFSLYNGVREQGGLEKMSDASWSNVCRNVTHCQDNSKFLTIRKYFKRVLLPFEKFLHEADKENGESKSIATSLPTKVDNGSQLGQIHLNSSIRDTVERVGKENASKIVDSEPRVDFAEGKVFGSGSVEIFSARGRDTKCSKPVTSASSAEKEEENEESEEEDLLYSLMGCTETQKSLNHSIDTCLDSTDPYDDQLDSCLDVFDDLQNEILEAERYLGENKALSALETSMEVREGLDSREDEVTEDILKELDELEGSIAMLMESL